MKKTFAINIGNSIIYLEEDAFESLTTYLTGIKKHFYKSIDDLEIVTDIENRIAELLLEKLKTHQKQVINYQDVQEVIVLMGNPADFEESEEDQNMTFQSARKQLYRDVDKKILAGVCAGFSPYLNVSVNIIRLLFLVFIFLWGFGIIFYLALWLIVPPAKRRLDKMAMHGEVPDLHGFKKRFDEEMLFAKSFDKSFPAQLVSVITDIFKFIGKIFSTLAQFFIKSIAFFVILFGIGFMLLLIITTASFVGFLDENTMLYFPLNIVNPEFHDGILLASFITLFIPILILVLLSIRYLFNKQVINRTLSYSLLVIWIAGVCSSAYYIARISSEFKETAEITEKVNLPVLKTYVLELDKSKNLNRLDSLNYGLLNMPSKFIIIDDYDNNPYNYPRNVKLDFVANANNNAYLSKNFQSQGSNFKEALDNARAIDYKFHISKDTIYLSPRLALQSKNWRNQEVDLILGLPIGTKIKFDRELAEYLGFSYLICLEDQSTYEITEEGLVCTSTHTDTKD